MIFGFRDNNSNENDSEKYLNVFLCLIPEFCVDQDDKLVGAPEEWQPRIISYSLYLGLAIGDLDKRLCQKLLEGVVSAGLVQTSDLALIGLTEVKKASRSRPGERWSQAVSFLNKFMSLTSLETTGPRADERIVKQRAPISGFIPALRLTVEDPVFAHMLYSDAVDEQQICDAEELSARIDWMKQFVDEALRRN